MNADHAVRAACAALLCAAPSLACAQAGYPARAIRVVVPSSAGGGTDIVARTLAPKLAERIGQQIVIDNRPGAGTMIGIELAARAPADGYTILVTPSTLALNSAIYSKVPYDPLRDFAPITRIIDSTSIVVVHPSLPVKSVRELVAFARARPGQLNYASAGIGTYPHMTMELFNHTAGLRMAHIPYKGMAPAMIDMVAGQITVMAATILTGMPQVRAGRLRPLGITSLKRVAAAPGIPTVAEAGLPGFESLQWYGAAAPAQVPREIVQRLHAEITAVLALPEVRQRFVADGTEPVGDTPGEFAAYVKSELVKWANVAKAAGVKAE
ncbi:MAG: tripartite tricarboxylate transporter substrate binding protein [Burkholderiales bacterium]|nr:tripartite tricarboxylate transporter substrate binding protein [Burkholderiales bacterium]